MTAIDKKFIMFGLTEHMPRYRQQDLYPEEIENELNSCDTLVMYDQFYEAAKQLKIEFKDNIKLAIGMEIEWIYESTFDQLKILLKKYSLDYVVGSVHHINGVPIDYDRATFDLAIESEGSLELLFHKYYDEQFNMIKMVKPKVVGHFDLIRMNFVDFHYPKEVRSYLIHGLG